jgi:hypothetical protein
MHPENTDAAIEIGIYRDGLYNEHAFRICPFLGTDQVKIFVLGNGPDVNPEF